MFEEHDKQQQERLPLLLQLMQTMTQVFALLLNFVALN